MINKIKKNISGIIGIKVNKIVGSLYSINKPNANNRVIQYHKQTKGNVTKKRNDNIYLSFKFICSNRLSAP